MKIFLTWSGKTSHTVALALHDWIPRVLQRVQPFLSSEDIRKGANWQQAIASQLQSSGYAIACLTRDNLKAPWIYFEAGAVSKLLDASKVTSLMIGIEPKDIEGPLTQFQNTAATETDIKKLIGDLNKELGPDALEEKHLTETFDAFWPRLKEALAKAAEHATTPTVPTKRSSEAVLDEILDVSRSTSRNIASIINIQERFISILERMSHPAQTTFNPYLPSGGGGIFAGTPLSAAVAAAESTPDPALSDLVAKYADTSQAERGNLRTRRRRSRANLTSGKPK